MSSTNSNLFDLSYMTKSNSDNLIVTLTYFLIGIMVVVSVTIATFTYKLRVTPADVFSEVKKLDKRLEMIDRIRTTSDSIYSYFNENEVALIEIDSSGKISTWSDKASKFFLLSREEALGKDISVIIPEGAKEAHQKAFKFRMQGNSESFHKTLHIDVDLKGEKTPLIITLIGTPKRSVMAIITRDTKEM